MGAVVADEVDKGSAAHGQHGAGEFWWVVKAPVAARHGVVCVDWAGEQTGEEGHAQGEFGALVGGLVVFWIWVPCEFWSELVLVSGHDDEWFVGG